jgi:hypothetical protein
MLKHLTIRPLSMEKKNETRTQIRPLIKEAKILENCSKEEVFQNLTLRPILKLQNNLLLGLFQNQLLNGKIIWKELSSDKKESILERLFKKDLLFKNSIIYLIVGQFTVEELDFFLTNKKAFSKRICQMAKERVFSQID